MNAADGKRSTLPVVYITSSDDEATESEELLTIIQRNFKKKFKRKQKFGNFTDNGHFSIKASPLQRLRLEQKDDVTLALAPEMLLRVFRLLDVQSLVRAGQVCRRWRAVAKDDTLWRHRDLELVDKRGFYARYSRRGLLSDSSSCSDTSEEEDRIVKKYRKDDKTVLRKFALCSEKHKARRHRPLREFFAVLVSAPCLNRLKISRDVTLLFIRHIIKSNCKVRAMDLTGELSHAPFRDWPDWRGDLLESFADSLEDLEIDHMTSDIVPSIMRMSLKKLVFTFCSDSVASVYERESDDNSEGGCYTWKETIPVFPHLPSKHSTLVEFRAIYATAPETISSALTAFCSTLQSVEFYCSLTKDIIDAISLCGQLRELRMKCTPKMSQLQVPSLQRLILHLKSTSQDPKELRRLPSAPRLCRLELYAPSRMSLQRDVEAAAEGGRRIPSLQSLTFLCRPHRRLIDVPAHLRFLAKALPGVQARFADIPKEPHDFRYW